MPDTTRESPLPKLLRHNREAAGLSLGQLAEATGISKTHLFNLEQGAVSKIQPAMLSALSEPLDIPTADLYSAANIPLPTELPSFTPYLRSRYGQLPVSAQAELQQSFQRITEKYGYDRHGRGPVDGEDET